jgi:hypothetical protein
LQKRKNHSLSSFIPLCNHPSNQTNPKTQDTMRFISALVAGALAVVAAAQTGGSDHPNPFTNTDFQGIAAGESFDITWTPTTDGTVTLVLVQGDPGDLQPVATIEGAFASITPFPLFCVDLLLLAIDGRVGSKLLTRTN